MVVRSGVVAMLRAGAVFGLVLGTPTAPILCWQVKVRTAIALGGRDRRRRMAAGRHGRHDRPCPGGAAGGARLSAALR
jgi:hypothetical protein